MFEHNIIIFFSCAAVQLQYSISRTPSPPPLHMGRKAHDSEQGQISIEAATHIEFLFNGLLPWATEGSLFTSTLASTREKTTSTHGTTTVDVIARFVSHTPETILSSRLGEAADLESERYTPHWRVVSLGIARFISKAGDKIFKPAVVYLLEGLSKGLRARPGDHLSRKCLPSSELNEIMGLSRFTGLPEIANDLYAIYCGQVCGFIQPDWQLLDLPGGADLRTRITKLEDAVDQGITPTLPEIYDEDSPLRRFLKHINESRTEFIGGAGYAPACESLIKVLDHTETALIDQNDLFDALEALWDEAERRGFIRPVVVHLPPLLFHPSCMEICVLQNQKTLAEHEKPLTTLLTTATKCLQKLSKSRVYIVATLAKSLRKAVLFNASVIEILPLQSYILDFVNNPPAIKPEFLFEIAAAERLQQFLRHRTFTSYYGQREWLAYAAIIDLVQRLPKQHIIAKNILDSLLEPWKSQQVPILVKNPWKQTFQLQMMLILSEYCIEQSQTKTYIDSFMHALVIEPWPRYRHLLEWITARLYCRSLDLMSQKFSHIENVEAHSPIQIASLIKLGLLVAPSHSEDFAVNLAMQLTCFSTSPKVHIRHEANYAFPLLFDLAETNGWKGITENLAFKNLNAFVRRLDKFKAAAWSIRTLKMDVNKDFTLSNIFQGQYLFIESPEPERVTYEDFVALQKEDDTNHFSEARISPGEPQKYQHIDSELGAGAGASHLVNSSQAPTSTQAFLQTKASFNLNSLHPKNGLPSLQLQRPSSVVLVASLIDNPTNLGGLSRISESFGLETMYIDELKHIAHKDFRATSVNSEKHLPIRELKGSEVPQFLLSMKRDGYEVVGVEQTDRSVILGHEVNDEEAADLDGKIRGTLPKKCALVLGSEKAGISAEVLAVLDRCVEIKTVGVTRSLNVQTAGGIALYEWWRVWGR